MRRGPHGTKTQSFAYYRFRLEPRTEIAQFPVDHNAVSRSAYDSRQCAKPNGTSREAGGGWASSERHHGVLRRDRSRQQLLRRRWLAPPVASVYSCDVVVATLRTTFRLQLAIGTSPCEPEIRKKGMHAAFYLRLVKACVTLDQLASQRGQEPGIPRRQARSKSRPGELLLRDLQGKFPRLRPEARSEQLEE